MSVEKVQGDTLYTPRRVQKCLFGSDSSSRKKKIHNVVEDVKTGGDSLSGEESDLGPMSPLDLSDNSSSSNTSSPKIQILSPNLTPKRLSVSFNMNASWHENPPSTRKKDHTRMSLKEAIEAVTYSARKKILPDSPTSLSNTPQKTSTLNGAEINMDEYVPETPEREFGKELQNTIVETPRKCDSPEYKLITPFTTENKMVLLPRVHRRKSLNILDAIENSSPQRKENTLKRHALEEPGHTAAKLLKTDENQSVPKARAALFQDKNGESKNESRLKTLMLSTKNFYNSSTETKENYKQISRLPEQKYQRKSYMGHSSYHRRSLKRHTIGGINAGVSHGIRKRKPRASLNASRKGNNSLITNSPDDSAMVEDAPKKLNVQTTNVARSSSPEERSPSPEIDLNKRFFKLKRASKRNCSAIVTISKNVKLKVASDGSVKLSQKYYQPTRQGHKRAKYADISFDATDLLVDEPELEATIGENKVASILKVLEDDWADDDYDTLETLTNVKIAQISPLKTVSMLNDVTMSPASELSNMTSTMNIKDIGTPTTINNSSCLDTNEKNDENSSETKYFPLFNKGYSSNKIFKENGKRTTKENLSWQLSAKLNGGDNQYQLDAGQKKFGASQCTECGVVYQVGDPEDENAHLNFHNNRKVLKFAGWKTERVIMEDSFTSSRVILVEPGDSKISWKKVLDVLEYVDRDLGLADTKISDYEQKKVYLYVRDKAIIGVLVAEPITTAHRMIPELLELDCCTAESSPAKCGINVVWTDLNHRRQGIATKLVDLLRAQFYFGYIMSMDDIAFSIPTPSGKIFAEKYTKTRSFKVYS